MLLRQFFLWFLTAECLLKLQELQGSVIECSSCKLRTLLPANGVDGLDKNMDLLSAVLQSEQEEQKLCNFCIQKVYPPKPATFHCFDCDVLMCGSCSDIIHSQLEFRCHDIGRANGNKDDRTEEDPRQTVSSRPSSSSSTLSKRSSRSCIKPLSSRSSSSLLNYSAIPGNYNIMHMIICCGWNLSLFIFCKMVWFLFPFVSYSMIISRRQKYEKENQTGLKFLIQKYKLCFRCLLSK